MTKLIEQSKHESRERGWYWLTILQQVHLEWVEVDFANFWTGEQWLHRCVETAVLCRIPTPAEIASQAQPSEVVVSRELLEKARTLIRLLTVRQVIDAGDEAISAAGLNPWCMNEGLASGDERIDTYQLDAALSGKAVRE